MPNSQKYCQIKRYFAKSNASNFCSVAFTLTNLRLLCQVTFFIQLCLVKGNAPLKKYWWNRNSGTFHVDIIKNNYIEAISKLLKIVKAPSLRSVKGSVFPPSHKATAGQAPVTLQVASANYPLQLFANGIESHFLNDFWNYLSSKRNLIIVYNKADIFVQYVLVLPLKRGIL